MIDQFTHDHPFLCGLVTGNAPGATTIPATVEEISGVASLKVQTVVEELAAGVTPLRIVAEEPALLWTKPGVCCRRAMFLSPTACSTT